MRVVLLLVLIAGACSPTTGIFDPNKRRDAGPGQGSDITGADIGTRCVYDPQVGANPTNECKDGLECLIVTRDGTYNAAGMSLDVWEDQFSLYRQDGKDEGYCTLIGNWSAPPVCPAGSHVKYLMPSAAVCVRDCETSQDCARDDYVCDRRWFGDFAFPNATDAPACVIGCQLDYPTCLRTGVVGLPNNARITHIATQDIQGASTCDVPTGVCTGAPHDGTTQAGPGEPCIDTNDCAAGMVCIPGILYGQGGVGSPGFCGAACKPDPQQPSCVTGYLCQAGFLFGFGNPLDPNVGDGNGFPLLDLGTNEVAEAGGFCFHECTAGAVDTCANFPGTECGSADPNQVGFAWNGASMCLPNGLRL